MRTFAHVAALLPLLAVVPACGKVPIVPVDAGFALADASWFAEEGTMFVFYDVRAEQGLGEPSVIEITWATDDERVEWTDLHALEAVHTHEAVDCGTQALCGSMSLAIPIEPRDVDIRLRYHRDGELALEADTVFNVVGTGAPHLSRSLVLYGVFDAVNQQVQWRSRHQFPTVRNMQASELGLRRDFTVDQQRFGEGYPEEEAGPYSYGARCADGVDAGLPAVTTNARAVFDDAPLPVEASSEVSACATATVTDAHGTFTTDVWAFKNPETRAAFPTVRSTVEDAVPLRFHLAPCTSTVEPEHEEMQRQRLLSPEDEVPTTCIDDAGSEGFVDRLTVLFREAVQGARPAGRDMVLVIGVHRDDADDDVADAVEEALAPLVVAERHRNTPRLAGAFVFDSDTRGLEDPVLARSTLWCPSTLSTDTLPDTSQRSCPTLPDMPGLDLGPFSFSTLPILPNQRQYLTFIDDYSVRSAGEVEELHFLAPEFPTTSTHADLGEFGVVTFLNGESFDSDADDAFSVCIGDGLSPFVLTTELMQDPEVQDLIVGVCADGDLDPELCGYLLAGVLPVGFLNAWHQAFPGDRYELGLFWEFPFLMRMRYRASVGGAVSGFGLSVPFGISSPTESLYGAAAWDTEAFSLDGLLTQCRRFCDHPTFDNAGVYQVQQPFRETYGESCYDPLFPAPGDGGFPLDP